VSAQTPSQKLAEIRRTISTAKRDEQRAILELPREEWNQDYKLRKGRTLSGTKIVDVDVNFEIDKDDLEALGYHHTDDCEGSELDPDEGDANLRALSDWHDTAHGLTLWAACPHEPCNLLSDEFRRTP
jgi:hypothetical protein